MTDSGISLSLLMFSTTHMLILAIVLLTLALSITLKFCFSLRKQALQHRQDKQENKAARLALQQSNQRQTSILNSLNDALIIINKDLRISFANKTAESIFKGRLVKGRSIDEAFIDHHFTELIKETFNSKKPQQKDIVTSPHYLDSKSSGNTHVFQAQTSLLHDSDGHGLGIVIRDISEEHRSQQIRQDFVANASHELRTPMAIINGYLENLLEDDCKILADRESSQKILTIMHKHGQRISVLIDDMLTISRIESVGDAPLNHDYFPLSDCLFDIKDRLDALLSKKQAQLSFDIEPPELEIYGDRFYFTQIFFNLIENALKENTHPGLRVQVKAFAKNKTTVIKVSDNGIGIPSAALPYIFKRFYRVDKHHNQDKVKGTGLGLSIVMRAVEAHGGEITVTSTPQQKTTFKITLPRHQS